jgi:hypothetical protein
MLRVDALQTMSAQEKNRLGTAREAVREGVQAHTDWLERQAGTLTEGVRRLEELRDTTPKQRRAMEAGQTDLLQDDLFG